MHFHTLLAPLLGVFAVACAASSAPSTDDSTGSDLSASACVDATTLTCKAGYEVSEKGCAQSHVAGSHPYGRCVKADDGEDAGTDAATDDADAATDDACVDALTLTCEPGYEVTEDGCLQSHVAGAHPYGHCAKAD